MGQLPEMRGLFVTLIVACTLLGVALGYAIPWLWSIVRPLIHALTA